MIKASIAGASGYSGGELVRLLARHSEVELCHLAAGKSAGQAFEEVYPNFHSLVSATLTETDWQRLGQDSDVVFLCLPHGHAIEAAPVLLEAGARVIDVGADFRLQNTAEYQQWYGVEHTQPELLAESVYGLPELNRDAIRSARVVGNPGCYPTAATLALLPILELLGDQADSSIVVDAKSGTSGAGRTAATGTLYCEVNENVKPYKVADHRHAPEMEQTLKERSPHRPTVFFTPHLIPMTRGISAACYVRSRSDVSQSDLYAALHAAYDQEPFVRVREEPPQTKATFGSNYCDVAVRHDPRSGMICAMSAIDNLGKGAAGQAVQNMNLLFGLEETKGIDQIPLYP